MPLARYSYVDLVFYTLLEEYENTTLEPISYEEVVRLGEAKRWKQAIKEEMASLRAINIWILILRPKNQKLVDCKWLYKLKEGMTSSKPLRF